MLFNKVESILKVWATQQHSRAGSSGLSFLPLVADRAQIHSVCQTTSRLSE